MRRIGHRFIAGDMVALGVDAVEAFVGVNAIVRVGAALHQMRNRRDADEDEVSSDVLPGLLILIPCKDEQERICGYARLHIPRV